MSIKLLLKKLDIEEVGDRISLDELDVNKSIVLEAPESDFIKKKREEEIPIE